jgi:hypothetical protein
MEFNLLAYVLGLGGLVFISRLHASTISQFHARFSKRPMIINFRQFN